MSRNRRGVHIIYHNRNQGAKRGERDSAGAAPLSQRWKPLEIYPKLRVRIHRRIKVGFSLSGEKKNGSRR